MIVSATRSDAPTVASTAVGSTRMNLPELPESIISGRKANMIVAGAAEDRLEDLLRGEDRRLSA